MCSQKKHREFYEYLPKLKEEFLTILNSRGTQSLVLSFDCSVLEMIKRNCRKRGLIPTMFCLTHYNSTNILTLLSKYDFTKLGFSQEQSKKLKQHFINLWNFLRL